MNAQDIEFVMYFEGDEGATEGTFRACVKFIEGANTETGELGLGNTRGENVNGFWTLLNPAPDTGESYSVLTALSYLGETFTAVVKPAGVDENQNQLLRSDIGSLGNDNNVSTFSSPGLVDIENGFVIPSTPEECETILPSRIGL